jgi:hypothetical protein
VAKIRVEWCGRFARGIASASLVVVIGLYAVQQDVSNAIRRIRSIRNPARCGITNEMSERAFASGATSGPRLQLTSDARGAKPTTPPGSDRPRNAVEASPVDDASSMTLEHWKGLISVSHFGATICFAASEVLLLIWEGQPPHGCQAHWQNSTQHPLAARLKKIQRRLWDLLPVVRNHVYHPAFAGSFSLKAVLPALVSEMSYDGMPVANGQDAGLAWESPVPPCAQCAASVHEPN